MLLLDAEICFNKNDGNSEHALSNDLDTSNIIRPSINFGDNLLFSGTISVDKEVRKIIRGENYKVLIEMPTVDNQAYEEIHDLLKIGSEFLIQNASKVVGEGRIINFIYEQRK